MSQQDRNIASTFAKGMAVLAAFDGSASSLSLADISRVTGQDRAAARRGALTLEQLGYLKRSGRQFLLTPKVLALAGGFLRANRFGSDVQPVLNQHAAVLGSEIALAVRDQDRVLLIAQSTVLRGPVSFGFTPGSHLPLLHTSLGRMLLACEPEGLANGLAMSAPMPRHTEHALMDRQAIAATVQNARTDGFCISDSEFENGILGYAVPVNGPDQSAVVAGTTLPRGAAGGPGKDSVLQALQLCASELRQNSALQTL